MNSGIFFEWLKRFDFYVSKKEGRKAILLLDNCSAHGNASTIPELANTEVIFLPPRTTSRIQPCDAGIIAAVKMRYRKRQIQRALGFIDELTCENADIYKINQLLSMRWMTQICKELDASVIESCWRHTGLVGRTMERNIEEDNAPNVLVSDREELEQLVTEVILQHVRKSINELVHPQDEDDCIEVVDNDNLVEQVVHEFNPVVVEKECEDEVPTEPELSTKEKLEVLMKALRICGNMNKCPPAVRVTITAAQREIRSEHTASLGQARITMWFC